MLKERVADRTLSWTDVDKISFLWGYDLVIVYIDKEYHIGTRVITNHDSKVLEEIHDWLGTEPKLPVNPFELEGEYGAEVDRD